MKIAIIIVRILLGLLFVFSSVVVLFDLVAQPELEGDVKRFMEGLEASVYLIPLIKVVELVCGLAFVFGFFVPLATVIIFPVSLNIFLFHVFVDPAGLAIAIIVLLANLFLAFVCRNHYRPLFAAKIRAASRS